MRRSVTVPPAGWLLCFTYVLLRPVSNGQILYPLLALLVLLSVAGIVLGRRDFPPPWMVGSFLLLMIAVTFGAFVGSQHANMGFVQQSIQWFGALVVWTIWASSITFENVRPLLTVIAAATVVLAGGISLFVAASHGLIPQVLPQSVLESQNAGIDLGDTGSAVRLYGLSTLAAAGPLVTAMAFVRPDPLLPPRVLCRVAAALAAVAVFVADRRAILVVMLLTPLLLWVLQRDRSRRLRIAPAVAVSSPVLLLAGAAVWSVAQERVTSTVADTLQVYFHIGHGSAAVNPGNILLQQEASQLFGGWGQYPILGSGLGGLLPSGYTRSAVRPWSFELQYHQLLFNLGLVGAVLVFLAFALALRSILRVTRQVPEHASVVRACLIAAVAMLLANATDPYLQAVGHGWSVALVAGVAAAVSRGPQSRLVEELLHDAPVVADPEVAVGQDPVGDRLGV